MCQWAAGLSPLIQAICCDSQNVAFYDRTASVIRAHSSSKLARRRGTKTLPLTYPFKEKSRGVNPYPNNVENRVSS